MITRRLAAIAVAALLCVGPATTPTMAQDKQPPLRTGVDGTFAPHAMPKLGGGIEGFQVDLFTEVAKRMKRDITIDSIEAFLTRIVENKPENAVHRSALSTCIALLGRTAVYTGREATWKGDIGIPIA